MKLDSLVALSVQVRTTGVSPAACVAVSPVGAAGGPATAVLDHADGGSGLAKVAWILK